MKIISRVENPLLGRVELEFQIQHKGQSTPSRKDVVAQVVAIEPGAKANLVVVRIQTQGLDKRQLLELHSFIPTKNHFLLSQNMSSRDRAKLTLVDSDEDGGEA